MANSDRIQRVDERQSSLKRTVLRLGVPLALLASVAGATPASAANSHACGGLVTATVVGQAPFTVPAECAGAETPGIDQFLKCCD